MKWKFWYTPSFLVLLAALFVPLGRMPSAWAWIVAYIRGDLRAAYFPLPGTAEELKEKFYQKHPDFCPPWQDVHPDQNGYFQLHQLITSGEVDSLDIPQKMWDMQHGDETWDTDEAEQFLDQHTVLAGKIHHACALPQSSAKGIISGQMPDTAGWKKISDLLLISMRHHLETGNTSAAFKDFSSIMSLCAHIEGHELPTMLDATLTILLRSGAANTLTKCLRKMPPDMDLSEWITHLEKQPLPTKHLANFHRGEAWFFFEMYVPSLSEQNTIWDYSGFETAYALNLSSYAKFFDRVTGLPDEKELAQLESELRNQISNITAQDLDDYFPLEGIDSWTRGLTRAICQKSYTLAALQLLQSEREFGLIESTGDPRLKDFAVDPSCGTSFHYDPEKRTLSPGPGSHIPDEAPILLPAY